jgi:uncharacterized membrane protein
VLALYVPALVVALVITVVEMTEVVAVVFALGAEGPSLGHGAMGAVAGTSVIAVVAVGFSAALVDLPSADLLWGASVVLFAFGIFLFRSTLRAFRRQRAAASGGSSAPPGTSRALLFGGGFVVGAIEATEAVIVLVALAAAGYGFSALIGALVGGAALAIAAVLVHQQIRKIKVLTLRLGATSMLFTFSVFWGGEAAQIQWPGSDLFLIVLFVGALVVVRGLLELILRRSVPVKANG